MSIKIWKVGQLEECWFLSGGVPYIKLKPTNAVEKRFNAVSLTDGSLVAFSEESEVELLEKPIGWPPK